MSLDPAYLEYPRRRHGYDHDLYDWSAIHTRPDFRWPGGVHVAAWIVISLEWFPIEPNDVPFRAPGHMQTPYPDYRHYTARDYGNRVGIWRMLDALKAHGLPASIAMNSAIASRYPALLDRILADGHEIIAHGRTMNDSIASGMAPGAEAAIIQGSLAELAAAGVRPTGWLSIARSQSWDTATLLQQAGLTYCCDWVNDELPWAFRNGLINLPLNHELSDRQVVMVQQQSADSYAQQIGDAADWLLGEGAPRLLPIHVTPYIMGLPYRIAAFEVLLAGLVERQLWVGRGDAIVNHWSQACR